MPCYHPKKAFILGVNNETGKKRLLIRPYETEFVWDNNLGLVSDFVEIPCGQCIGCRLNYSREWANRMMMELQYQDSAYFLTLTYNDKHLPYRENIYEDGSKEITRPTLNKKDLQLFWKHLRQKFPNDHIRYFACGEYGSQTKRPHYHAIVYGIHLDPKDLKPYKQTKLGFPLFECEKFNNAWSEYEGNDSNNRAIYNNLGFVVVSNVSWETCAYVARYVTKKMSEDVNTYVQENNLVNPFCVMSRRSGIGEVFYRENPDCMDYEYINLGTDSKGMKFKPPRYFEKLLEKEDPERAKQRAEKRKEHALNYKELLLSKTDKDYLTYLSDSEKILEEKLKALDRLAF